MNKPELPATAGPDAILRAAFDVMRVGICLVDAQGCFVSANQAFCAMTGFTADELAGKHWINARVADAAAAFEIIDEGIGIPPQDHERLFEAFHRARNVGNIASTGLGLAIVKKSVELHGGSIAFTSEVGRGTRFTVTLPLHSDTAARR